MVAATAQTVLAEAPRGSGPALDQGSPGNGHGDGRIDNKQYIAFELGEQCYGVEITMVREIRQWAETAELPEQPPYGCGVWDIRGEIVPIYDLSARLGGPAAEITKNHMVLILSIGERRLGVLVDAVSEIISIGRSDLRSVPDTTRAIEPGTITNLAAHGENMIALLNCKALFGGAVVPTGGG